MKILQREIDLIPANEPSVQGAGAGVKKGGGLVVLELDNASPAINTFRVWVKSGNDEEMAKLANYTRLDQATAGEVPDKREDGKYIAQAKPNTKRRVAVTFKVPKIPKDAGETFFKSRVYDVNVEVEADETVGQGPQAQRRASFPVKIVVRPFFDWDFTATTKSQVFGRLRKRRTYMLVLENRGNDWLYVDLKFSSELPNLKGDLDTDRIAVPPAISGEHPSRREIPLRVWYKGKGMVGSPTGIALPITASRVDAPSVTRFPDVDTTATVQTLNLGQPVLIEKTAETKAIAKDVQVVYRPPIPKTVPDLVSAIRQNAMMILGLFLMATIAFYGIAMFWANTQNANSLNFVTPDGVSLTESVPVGASIIVSGEGLIRSALEIKDDQGNDVTNRFDTTLVANPKEVLKDLMHTQMKSSDSSQYWVIKPKGSDADLKKMVINIQRRVFGLILLPGLMNKSQTLVIGTSFALAGPPPTYSSGTPLKLYYLGDAQGVTISVNGGPPSTPNLSSDGHTFIQVNTAALHGPLSISLKTPTSPEAQTLQIQDAAQVAAASGPAGAPGNPTNPAGTPQQPAGAPSGGGSGGGTGSTPSGQPQPNNSSPAAGGFAPNPGYAPVSQVLSGTGSGNEAKTASAAITGGGTQAFALRVICDALAYNSGAAGTDFGSMNNGAAPDDAPNALKDAAQAMFFFASANDPDHLAPTESANVRKKVSDIMKEPGNQQAGSVPYLVAAWLAQKTGMGPNVAAAYRAKAKAGGN